MPEPDNDIIEQQISQDDKEVDISVKGILENLDESQDFTPTKPEQSKGQDDKVEKEQPESKYEMTEDEFKTLTEELGYSEDDLNEFERKDVDNILETKTQKPEKAEPTKEEEAEIIITEKIAEKYGGVFKNFVGKTFKEVAEAFRTSTNHINKLSTELKQYKEQTTKNEQKTIDELTELIKNPPKDMSEEDYFKKVDELVELKATLKSRASQPDTDIAKKEAEFFEVVQSQIPKEMKAEDIAEKWWASLTKQEQDAVNKVNNTMLVIREIKNYALGLQREQEVEKLKEELKKKEASKEKEAKILAAKKTTEAIRNANGKPVQGSRFNIVNTRDKSEYNNDTDITIKTILDGLED